AIVVAAPRDGALWEDLTEGTDLEHSATVHFLDMTDRRLPWFIQSVGRASADGGDGWVCSLAGDADAMVGGELVAEDNAGRERRYRIPQNDARRGRANLLLPSSQPPCWYVVRGRPGGASVGADVGRANGSGPDASPRGSRADTHPWRSWYFRAESLPDREKLEGAAIVRLRTREGLIADRIVAAAIQSVYPESAIHHVDPLGPPDELPAAGAVVCVGDVPTRAPLMAWLRRCLERGGRVLCLPTEEASEQAVGPGDKGLLPAWGRLMRVTSARVVPLRNVARPSDAVYGVDDILVKGLGQVRYSRLREPRFVERGKVLVVTKDESPFLAARRVGDSGHVLALAAPLSLASGSIAYHPCFPLLLRRVLFERAEVTQTALSDIEVGQSVDVLKWFGMRELEGTVTLPGGAEWDVRSPSGLPVLTAVSLAGPHLLDSDETERVRLANYPRLKRDATFTRDDWAARRPNTPAVWLSESDAALQEFDFIGEDPDGDKPGRYDLSPMAVPFVAAFLALELVGLLWFWRRGGGSSAEGAGAASDPGPGGERDA
ncbi:MAG: hypothetical protein ACYS9X_18975, partial [Planctomycetota bacterium]